MAYSPSDLYQEIRNIIQHRSEDGVIVNRSWLVLHILHEHPIKRHKGKDPDDFSLICRQLAVSSAVDRALAQLKKKDDGGDPDIDSAEIPLLPGFKHLRKVYPIKRSGDIYLIPLDQLTDQEVIAKISTYRKASRAFSGHADELARYLATRGRLAA